LPASAGGKVDSETDIDGRSLTSNSTSQLSRAIVPEKATTGPAEGSHAVVGLVVEQKQKIRGV